MLKESYGRVKHTLFNNRESLQEIAMQLLKKETMNAEEVKNCIVK